MQLTLDTTTLEKLLAHAASAARIVGSIDEIVGGAFAVGLLADDIDAIVHQLTELLGNPDLVAVPAWIARARFAPDVTTPDGVVTQDDVPQLVTGTGGAP